MVAASAAVPAYDPALFAEIRKRRTRVLDGDFDVFGDGTARLISAMGHTPGHQVLYLELAEFGPLILSGDLYHFRISREQRRVPMFNVDKDLTLTAMDKIEALVASTGATFWIEHDAALFKPSRWRLNITARGFSQWLSDWRDARSPTWWVRSKVHDHCLRRR